MKPHLVYIPKSNLEQKIVYYYNLYSLLTVGKIYECELCPGPDIYDHLYSIFLAEKFQPSPPTYLVKCDDGKFRKINVVHFITLEELREQKLNKIL